MDNDPEYLEDEWTNIRQKRGLLDICLSGEKCYAELGCFPCMYKFHAQSPDKINMVFYLHTDSNTTNQTVWYNDFREKIPLLRLDTGKDLWVIIHGFEGQWPLPWLQLMTTALISRVRASGVVWGWCWWGGGEL